MSMDPLFDIEQMQADAEHERLLASLPAWWWGMPDGPDRPGGAGKCLYDAPVKGLADRAATMQLWVEVYGNFGSGVDSHCWSLGSMAAWRGLAVYQLDRHEATCLSAHIDRRFRRPDSWDPVPPCGHDADAEADHAAGIWRGRPHRGACRKEGCDWEGPVRDDENRAVEDAMDHAHPGWRNLPPVPKFPDQIGSGTSKAAIKAVAAWEAKVIDVYPDGWLEAGGPIRTVREKHGTRHVEGRTPYGGYDLALTCHLCGAAENLTWLTSNDNSVTVAGCKDGCPQQDTR